MPKGKPSIPPELKKEILERVKRAEKPTKEIAEEHGVSPHVIYGWLSRGAIAPPTFGELTKLKRENRILTELIGRITVELSAEKKKGARA